MGVRTNRPLVRPPLLALSAGILVAGPLLLTTVPSQAQTMGGGGGGANFGAFGGAGGSGYQGTAGQPGLNNAFVTSAGTGGGGGSAGGGDGGSGGQGNTGADLGAAGAMSPGGGGAAATSNLGGGGGGGGGVNGTIASPVGGNGGAGGGTVSGAPGGGGAGGYGVVTTSDINLSASAVVAGGNGGAGGSVTSGTASFGGNGGDGGVGVLLTRPGLTLTNAGLIGFFGGTSQQGGAGGNASTGAGGGGGGNGGPGAVFLNGGTLINTGPLGGGNGGLGGGRGFVGGFGGNGGAGVVFLSRAGTVTNSAFIAGGNGANGTGAGGLAYGGAGGRGGDGLDFSAGGTITNSGFVTGGTGGSGGSGTVSSGFNAAGGVGIAGGNLTIVNSNHITGGVGGDGLTQANAIEFTSGINTLELQAGSSILGQVAAFSAADTLRLGGTANATFDASQIGTQYLGFGVYAKTGTGTWTLANTTNVVTPWTINQGTLAISADNNLGAASGSLTLNGGALQFLASFTTNRGITLNAGGGSFDTNGNSASLSGPIGGTGGLTNTGLGTLTLTGTSSYLGATNVNAGALQGGAANVFAPSSAVSVATGATLDLNGFNQTVGSLSGAGSVVLGTAALTLANASGAFSGIISGNGSLKQTAGNETLTAANAYTGGTFLNGGMLTIGNNSALGSGVLSMAAGTTLAFLNGGNFSLANNIRISGDPVFTPQAGSTQTISGVISNGGSPGAVELSGAGTLVLSAANTYTGPTNIDSGTLDVTGSIATSSLTSVGNGGVLTGTGTVGNTAVVGGGVFAPGNGTPGSSMTVAGNFAFAPGALYRLQVDPSTASYASVTGVATLGGAQVNAIYAGGSYVSKQYTILAATGGISGAFNSLVNTNLPSGFLAGLGYDANDVYLVLKLFSASTGLPKKQQNVADALGGFFNTTGSIPFVYGTLTSSGLSQASGEIATATQQATFNAMSLFMGMVTDPFIGNRGIANPSGGGTPQFAEAHSGAARDAYAAVYAKAPISAASFEPRWSVWAAAYGGSETTSANAVIGTSTSTSSVYGTVAGADFQVSPFTLAGFALAGGGTNFNVADGLGSGHSDLFQAGAFVRHTVGMAYLAGALAYGWQDVTTNRTVTIAGADQLQAKFNANAFSGRLEAVIVF